MLLVNGDIRPNSDLISPREKIRRRIVNLVFIIYGLLVFEGALRKWFLPELHNVLYFIREPFVLLVYVYALKGRFCSHRIILLCCTALSALVIIVIPIQAILNDTNPLVLLLGWRNYFFYIPLVFVISGCFVRKDLMLLIKYSLLISIPIFIVCFFQFISPPSSFINKGIGDDAFIFQVISGMVRTTGMFTFTLGHSFFLGSEVAMIAYAWLMPSSKLGLSNITLWIVTVSIFSMVAISGSRTVFFFVFLVFLAVFVSGFLMKGGKEKVKALFGPFILLIVMLIMFVVVFPSAFEAMESRQSSAVAEEGSTLVRALSGFYAFTNVIEEAPFLGYGIGSGSAGGNMLASGGYHVIMDDEWSRIILEVGPLLGGGYILLRVFLALIILSLSLKAARKYSNPLPLVLLGFLMMPLLNGVITTQGTVYGYVWLFLGFCFAAAKNDDLFD